MANFTNSKINRTYQRVVQVDGGVLQDGLGVTLSGSMSDLTVNGTLAITGHSDVSASLSRLDNFSSSLNDTFATDAELAAVSSSLALETAQLLEFSASLDATFATDAELALVSSSLAIETAQLLNFSASLDATFATDSELQAVSSSIVSTINSLPHSDISALNAATSSYALKSDISGSFKLFSGSVITRVEVLENFSSSLDATFATDAELTSLSSSFATTIDGISTTDISALNAATSSYALKTDISGSFNITSSSLASRITSQEAFSSSLNATFATDTELSNVSSSFASTIDAIEHTDISALNTFSGSADTRITSLENFSSSLDATFATDDSVIQAVSGLNDATGSYALKTEITGSFTLTSASLASTIASSAVDISNAQTNIANLTSLTSSYAYKNVDNSFSTDQTINGYLYASGSRIGSHFWDGQIFSTKAQFNDFNLEQNRNSSDGTDFSFFKSRGTPGAETHALPGDEVYNLRAYAYKSGSTNLGTNIQFSDYDFVAAITTNVVEVQSGSASGDIQFLTRAIDSTFSRVTIDQYGHISSSKNIVASTYYGDGSQLSNLPGFTNTTPSQNTYLVPANINGTPGGSTVLTASAGIYKCTYSGVNGTHVIYLPDATTAENTYRTIRFISDDSVTANDIIRISGSVGQTIDGGTTYDIDRNYEGIMVWSDGSNWFRIQSKA